MTEALLSIWRAIARFDATPSTRVPESEHAVAELERLLDQFADGRPFLVDSSELNPRPQNFANASEVFEALDQIEFIAIFENQTYWAVTEEEYEWLVFIGSS